MVRKILTRAAPQRYRRHQKALLGQGSLFNVQSLVLNV